MTNATAEFERLCASVAETIAAREADESLREFVEKAIAVSASTGKAG